jgi:hypothetical protein
MAIESSNGHATNGHPDSKGPEVNAALTGRLTAKLLSAI